MNSPTSSIASPAANPDSKAIEKGTAALTGNVDAGARTWRSPAGMPLPD
jgi:hypothetical protein